MDITAKDIILLVAGFFLSIVASAVWQYWAQNSSEKKLKALDQEKCGTIVSIT